MNQRFGSSFSAGFAITMGMLTALAICCAGVAGTFLYLMPAKSPTPPNVAVTRAALGTAEDAKSEALKSLTEHGIKELAAECKAGTGFDHTIWLVEGPAVADDGRVVRVSVTLNVGSVDGELKWSPSFLRIGDKAVIPE